MIEESNNINNFSRKVVISHVKWITSDTFENVVVNTDIHPYLVGTDNKKIYVGKGVLVDDKVGEVEAIGVVSKGSNGKWQIKITNGVSVNILESNFSVLSIRDPNSFSWVATCLSNVNNIPNFALKVIQRNLTTPTYIGRVVYDKKRKTIGKYFCRAWKIFNETFSSTFGKIYFRHKLFYAPVNGRVVAFDDNVEILCLKCTPASLKQLSCLKLREILDNNSETQINMKLKEFLSFYLEKQVLNKCFTLSQPSTN